MNCDKCGGEHTRHLARKGWTDTCTSHVDECPQCQLSWGNAPGRPCIECGTTVTLRPCLNGPMAGQKVCASHGGRKLAAMAKARAKLDEAKAHAELAKLLPDLPPVTNPLEEFPILARKALAWGEVIEKKIGDIPAEQWTKNSVGVGIQLHPLVSLFQPALAEARQMLSAYARLNIDTRLAAIEEGKAALIAGLIIGSLEEAEVPAEIAARVLEVSERRMRELEL